MIFRFSIFIDIKRIHLISLKKSTNRTTLLILEKCSYIIYLQTTSHHFQKPHLLLKLLNVPLHFSAL